VAGLMATNALRTRCVAACVAVAGVLAALAEACGHAPSGPTGNVTDASSIAESAASDSSFGAPIDAWGDESSGNDTSSTDSAPGNDSSTGGDSDSGADADAALARDASIDSSAATDAPGDAGPSGDGHVIVADAACLVEIDSPPLLPGTHVAIGTTIQWDSNPPSSGPHYPIWAAYQAYPAPVPRGYYVHDLEHGAVVFLYNCDDGGCPDVVAALQAASDAIPDDPLCTVAHQGVRVRTVITPDPLIDVPVAAAAWGWVYKAQCLDPPSLRDFAVQHYGQGPEMLCGNGTTQF
jgi:hypothetical protein